MTNNNLLSIIPQIKFVNRIKDIGLFDDNYRKYFIRHNFKLKTVGIIVPLKERGFIELNYNEVKSWYNDENNPENILVASINRLVYTDFKLNMILSYESSITDGTFNTSDLKYSFLEFKFNYYKTFNRNHTLRYYTWYTKSLGNVPLYLQTNYGGYDWAIGYSEYDLYAKNLKIYGCEYQYHYKNSLTFRFIVSKPTFIDSPIVNANIEELAQQARDAGDHDLAKQLERRSNQEKFTDSMDKMMGIYKKEIIERIDNHIDRKGIIYLRIDKQRLIKNEIVMGKNDIVRIKLKL